MVRLPAWLDGPDGTAERALGTMWLDDDGLVLTVEPLPAAEQSHARVADSVVKLAEGAPGYFPERVEVGDAELARYLREAIGPAGITVVLRDELPSLKAALTHMALHMNPDLPPGVMSGAGVTMADARAFAEAAAAFYQAAPWELLTDGDPIEITAPAPPAGFTLCSVMGSGGQVYGLAFYPTRKAYESVVRGETPRTKVPMRSVLFGPAYEVPFEDADAWEDEGFPIAGERAYPGVLTLGPVQIPLDVAALRFVTGALRAVAASDGAELDAGHWATEVEVRPGEVARYELRLPVVLEGREGKPTALPGPPPDMGRRAAERALRRIHELLERKDFATAEEANAFLASQLKDGQIPKQFEWPEEEQTPERRATEVVDQAWVAAGRTQLTLARKALEIWPDCADAYVILAQRTVDLQEAYELYKQGAAAGERALGPEKFKKYAGYFWGEMETRPFMRARIGVAQTLEQMGRLAEAVAEYKEMLRMNPRDNQGVRELLLPLLLRIGGSEREAMDLIAAYAGEMSVVWAYSQALLAFRQEGPGVAARGRLVEAVGANPYLPDYLLGRRPLPMRPPHYTMGSDDEAAAYVRELLPAWRDTPGALAWLEGLMAERAARQASRARPGAAGRPKKSGKSKSRRKRK